MVGGIPAALFAHLGRLITYEKQRNENGRLAAARALDVELRTGRWPVSAATYGFLDGEVQRSWPNRAQADDQLPIAEAVVWLWEQRTAG